ncbi:MAG: polyphosphate kinase 1 [Acidobacteria bacterium]|nr:polyphosphate kinase 1 [Acidobacteriota bacterium]MBP7475712.1 polyphosphate kinase 1 [Pyrinomonadaceae bacterium]MBP9110411.1 polyphosphate kinase 1 [Pyrinomonadaceae bacterium]
MKKHKTTTTASAASAASIEPLPAEDERQFFNRELSWLEFNRHVLDEATDETNPLLERLKFLSIFSTNLDEFFMIRVSGLKEQIAENIGELSPDGMTASEQLAEIYKRLRPMRARQASYLKDSVFPALAKNGITIEQYVGLNIKEKKLLDKYFRNNLFPILTPQLVDASHPFPYISNLSLNLGVFVEPNRASTQANLKHLFRQKRFTRIKLPPSAPRLVPIDQKKGRYALIEEVISANVHDLFPNMKTSEAFLFRVTRDADIEIREDEAGDLLRTMERELQRRRDRFPVRLEIAAAMPEKMVKLLMAGVGLENEEVERVDGFVDIPDLMQLYSLDKPRLKDRPFATVLPAPLHKKENIFDVIKKQDVLLHHPYNSFSAVSDFIAEAAEDPNVQAIKICLYRTGKDSPIVASLVRASRLGKQVTALVELKARFDEENNIEWARRLENEGVHVVYGISTLKTHSKVLLVVRREKDKLVRYVHLATGNYNPFTSRIYTDLALLTADEEIAEDASSLFNFLTGYSQQDKYKRLLVAPLNLRERLLELIRRESKNKAAGKPARVIMKANSITDDQLIRELYTASQAGVEIDLIIRGICTLRPGVKGLSENIRVRSVIGRFLEHSRVYYFANGGEENDEIFIGSADLMHRSFDRRVEVLTPVIDSEIKGDLRDILLPAYLKDQVNAYTLMPDGSYKKTGNRTKGGADAQQFFIGKDSLS